MAPKNRCRDHVRCQHERHDLALDYLCDVLRYCPSLPPWLRRRIEKVIQFEDLFDDTEAIMAKHALPSSTHHQTKQQPVAGRVIVGATSQLLRSA
jgi:hypothetical protein